jgi:hypothetical protein
MTALPTAVVTVTILGKSGTGARYSRAGASSLGDRGETGSMTGTVKVDASVFAEPALGSTIEVAGAQVWVVDVKPDPLGAFRTITFTEQRPLTVGTDL